MVLGIGTSTNTGLFGKTPAHPDFVRFNAGSPSARAWDEWINASLAEMRRVEGSDWEILFDAAPAMHFIARPSGDTRQVLAGHLRSSRDASGRRYPLTLFAEFQLDRQARGVQVLPYALMPFADEASRLADAGQSRAIDSTSIGSLGALVPENPADQSRHLADRMREVTMQTFWTAVIGSFENPLKYLCVKNLFGILAPLRGYEPLRLAMALRFPGSTSRDSVDPSTVMSIWASLCRAIVGDESMAASWLFWQRVNDKAEPGCYLYFRTPSAAVLTAMLDPGHSSDTIWDIRRIGAERIAEARDALGPVITGVLDAPRMPVLEFIQRI